MDHALVVFLDGDGSCDPADVAALERAAASGADLVLGRRERMQPGALPWHARLGNRMVAAVLRRRTGRSVRDLPPLKLVRAVALAALGVDEEGYGWTVQLVGRALAHPPLRTAEVQAGFHAVQRRPGLGQALLEVSELPAPFTIAVSAYAPTIPERLLNAAAAALATRGAVLGPGLDGGYYLVGLRRGYPRHRRARAYLEAPTGSEDVLAHTRSALGDPVLLPPWPDVDSAAELRRLARQLEGEPSAAPAVSAWLADHGIAVEEAG